MRNNFPTVDKKKRKTKKEKKLIFIRMPSPQAKLNVLYPTKSLLLLCYRYGMKEFYRNPARLNSSVYFETLCETDFIKGISIPVDM